MIRVGNGSVTLPLSVGRQWKPYMIRVTLDVAKGYSFTFTDLPSLLIGVFECRVSLKLPLLLLCGSKAVSLR